MRAHGPARLGGGVADADLGPEARGIAELRGRHEHGAELGREVPGASLPGAALAIAALLLARRPVVEHGVAEDRAAGPGRPGAPGRGGPAPGRRPPAPPAPRAGRGGGEGVGEHGGEAQLEPGLALAGGEGERRVVPDEAAGVAEAAARLGVGRLRRRRVHVGAPLGRRGGEPEEGPRQEPRLRRARAREEPVVELVEAGAAERQHAGVEVARVGEAIGREARAEAAIELGHGVERAVALEGDDRSRARRLRGGSGEEHTGDPHPWASPAPGSSTILPLRAVSKPFALWAFRGVRVDAGASPRSVCAGRAGRSAPRERAWRPAHRTVLRTRSFRRERGP